MFPIMIPMMGMDAYSLFVEIDLRVLKKKIIARFIFARLSRTTRKLDLSLLQKNDKKNSTFKYLV